jgi:DNA-binding XRE family transcriptional regulator
MQTKQHTTLETGSAAALKGWRWSAGLTQRELGRLACVARASISHIETGRYLPTAAFAGKISRALSAVLGDTVNTWDLFPGIFPRLPVVQRKLARRPPSAPARAAQRRAKRYKLQHTNEYTCNDENNQAENQRKGSTADEVQGRQG